MKKKRAKTRDRRKQPYVRALIEVMNNPGIFVGTLESNHTLNSPAVLSAPINIV